VSSQKTQKCSKFLFKSFYIIRCPIAKEHADSGRQTYLPISEHGAASEATAAER